MKRKVMVFIATSLDGYIATEDDSLDWLYKVDGEGDNGYLKFYDTIDTVILGRRTYDWIMNIEGEFPYKNKDCYVFTSSKQEPRDYVTFVNDNVVEFINSLNDTKGKNIWIVGGGNLLSDFIKENLVDEYIITVAPIILGKGIPLFKKQSTAIELELKKIHKYNQFVELHYVKK